ncbi:MAG: DUF3566 domain-containing protein [bacterium]|nr:DUF3566 domain-containing protein [bacterium]
MTEARLGAWPAPPTTQRRVRRILRKFDPWTVMKVSAVLSALAALGLVLLSVMLWAVISRLGLVSAFDEAAARVALIEPGESLFKTGGEYLRGMILLAASWMAGTTATLTVGAVLYNLLADLVGGIEFTVLEEVPVDTARHDAGGRSLVGGM